MMMERFAVENINEIGSFGRSLYGNLQLEGTKIKFEEPYDQ